MINYEGKTVAVGVVMMDKDGYDEMVVFNGVISKNNKGLILEIPNEPPMEMSKSWLEKLKPVESSMGEKFQKSEYCLIIASTSSKKS
jgi:hypothetical protein